MSFPFAYHRLIVGYHGCDRSVLEDALLQDQPLQPSDNRYDWLGRGVYFWEHGPRRAREFAEWKKSRGEIEEPAVLGAYIHLGRCFDLTDTHATQQLEPYFTLLEMTMKAKGERVPVNRKAGEGDLDLVLRDRDCAVLNFCMDELDRNHGGVYHQSVRGVFVEGKPAFPGAGIRTKTHVQIAVRDPECVIGYFKPPSAATLKVEAS